MEKFSNKKEETKKTSTDVNFHQVYEERKSLRQTQAEHGGKDSLIGKLYQEQLADVEGRASEFKIKDFGGPKEAVKILREQKTQYEKKIQKDLDHQQDPLDYEILEQTNPKLGEVKKVIEDIAELKEFRMLRMLEILNPQTSFPVKKTNETLLKTIKKEIGDKEKKLAEADPLILRQAEIVGYKEDLAKSGHICITPNVERDLDAIGDRMLTGKPMFLHGPTGTGKTSLARFASAHFTNKEPEMVFCNPQTREANVWGKTGIRPAENGAIETVEIYGPLARAMVEGKVVIFDEFTALPKEQMVFIKGVFNAKVGDKINIVGNGVVEIKPGFQMIFTANLKSEKNPERQDLPPEIAREFEQNNLEVKYSPPEETYDIILSRLLNRDGSLDMSFYDLNTTLPNLCKVMAEIQESYTNETDKEVARRAGAMDASGKVYSLKKFVMTQGSVEAILSSWLIEKQTGKQERSFSEFLEERFKTALTFKEYSKEDRILVAKILASKGFLLTLSAKDLDLPENIFQLNTIKQLRGEEAVADLRRESGAVRHLTLKEVAELDPFGKRVELLRNQAEALLGDEKITDPFLDHFDKKMGGIFGRETKNQVSEISAPYTYTNPKTKKIERQETITIDFEAKLQDFLTFYQSVNLDLPPDFADSMRDIWSRHQAEIKQAITEQGFDDLLLVPANLSLPDLKDKMIMESGYNTSSNFDEGGGFAKAQSRQDLSHPRLLLVHNTQNLRDRPELAQTLNTKGQDVKLDQALTLEDYLIFQRKYYADTNKHLDESGWTWLATKSGARLVCACWVPGDRQLSVYASDLTVQVSGLGVRPTRCFF